MTTMRSTVTRLVILVIAGGLGCTSLEAPDFNNPSIDELQGNPTRAAAAAAATGLLIGARENIGEFNGYVSLTGILGRESYNLDGADTRYATEMYQGAELNPGSPALGGNLWALRYQNIRNANILLNALESNGSAKILAVVPRIAVIAERRLWFAQITRLMPSFRK